MIKQVWIAQCDICGKEEKARLKIGQYNEDKPNYFTGNADLYIPLLPEGWLCGCNSAIHMCNECARKLAEGKA